MVRSSVFFSFPESLTSLSASNYLNPVSPSQSATRGRGRVRARAPNGACNKGLHLGRHLFACELMPIPISTQIDMSRFVQTHATVNRVNIRKSKIPSRISMQITSAENDIVIRIFGQGFSVARSVASSRLDLFGETFGRTATPTPRHMMRLCLIRIWPTNGASLPLLRLLVCQLRAGRRANENY